jgi:hypothetical protein
LTFKGPGEIYHLLTALHLGINCTMANSFGRSALLCLLLLCSACASSGRNSSERVDLDLITHEQIREHGFRNAYEAVAALRSNWLLTRGPDSFSTPTTVQVYYDATRLGGIETLRSLATIDIVYIKYFDGIAASGRWGLDHGQGVILVASRPL